VLVGGNGALQRGSALSRRRRIEEDRMIRARQRGAKIGGPVCDTVRTRSGREAVCVAAGEQQSRQQAIIAERKTAFIDDRNERAGEMLGRADAAGRAVHDDPDGLLRHRRRSTRSSPNGICKTMLVPLPSGPASGEPDCHAISSVSRSISTPSPVSSRAA
jgi:hypothetical protein